MTKKILLRNAARLVLAAACAFAGIIASLLIAFQGQHILGIALLLAAIGGYALVLRNPVIDQDEDGDRQQLDGVARTAAELLTSAVATYGLAMILLGDWGAGAFVVLVSSAGFLSAGKLDGVAKQDHAGFGSDGMDDGRYEWIRMGWGVSILGFQSWDETDPMQDLVDTHDTGLFDRWDS